MNMKRNTRKISILLVVVIICALGISMIPVTALAAEDKNYSSRVKITTDTNIVIPDGATYTYSKGISVEKGATLTISAEGEGTGKLVATSESNNVAAISVNAGSNLIINGGNIEAKTRTDDAAGIGGDKGKAAGNITINGGNITARSQSRGAAIGGGRDSGGSSSGKISINGRKTIIDAWGGEYAAGIGGGDEGGVDTIYIDNGATVTARGGKHGAGIGTGDVSDNGKKDAWKKGTIEIAGDKTKVKAFGGDYGGTGIGGGEDGYVNYIGIHDIGMKNGADGYVKAIGNENCAGIGGGNRRAFGQIVIQNAVVSASTSFGAGIGTGGGKPGNSSDSPETGGEMHIENSAVVAISTMGGAGIGGGIFSHANSIDISGGVVIANGGAEIAKETLASDSSLLMGDLMSKNNFENKLLHLGNVAGSSNDYKGVLNNITQMQWHDESVYLLNTKGKGKYYSGAGIGGGYKAAGGTIVIRDNAAICAAAGMLDPEYSNKIQDESNKSAAAIGCGRNYSGNERTKVNVYTDSVITAGKLSIESKYVGYYNGEQYHLYDTYTSDVFLGSASNLDAMSRIDDTNYQLTIIQPGVAVVFDSNGGPNVNTQLLKKGEFATEPDEPVWTGHEFRGWHQVKSDGTISDEQFDFNQPIYECTVLQAKWNDINAKHKVNIDESLIEHEIYISVFSAYKDNAVYVYSTSDKVKDVIVTDDLGNRIDRERYDIERYLWPGAWVEEGFKFYMPARDVNVNVVLADYYNITMEPSIPEGFIETETGDTAYVGQVVRMTVNDIEGFKWNEILVMDEDYNLIKVINIGPNQYAFYMPASNVTIGADIYGSDEQIIYRAYNPNTGEHLFTSNIDEYKYLIELGWNGEGIACYTLASSDVPIYRLFNPNTGGHHYTNSIAERDNLVSVGWTYEGIAFYSVDYDDASPVYRLYNPNATGILESGSHHYTTNREEADYLVSLGWQDEGIGWYGVSSENLY